MNNNKEYKFIFKNENSKIIVNKTFPIQLTNIITPSEYLDIADNLDILNEKISNHIMFPFQIFTAVLFVLTFIIKLTQQSPTIVIRVLVPLLSVYLIYALVLIFLISKKLIALGIYVRGLNTQFKHRFISFSTGYIKTRFTVHHHGVNNLSTAGSLEYEKSPLLQDV